MKCSEPEIKKDRAAMIAILFPEFFLRIIKGFAKDSVKRRR
jgi:hypothetical protein